MKIGTKNMQRKGGANVEDEVKPTVFIVVDQKDNFIAEINLENDSLTASNDFKILYGIEDELWGDSTKED